MPALYKDAMPGEFPVEEGGQIIDFKVPAATD